MLAYLCAVNNPADDLRLVRILNNPPRGIGPATVQRAPVSYTHLDVDKRQVFGLFDCAAGAERARRELGETYRDTFLTETV